MLIKLKKKRFLNDKLFESAFWIRHFTSDPVENRVDIRQQMRSFDRGASVWTRIAVKLKNFCHFRKLCIKLNLNRFQDFCIISISGPCPMDYPYAFDSGEKCCTKEIDGDSCIGQEQACQHDECKDAPG